MKKVLLDTSFILSAIGNKIDIFEELTEYKVVIPEQVLAELERVVNSKKKLKFRSQAKLALKLIGKSSCEKVDLGKGHVDDLIVRFAKQHKNLVVATLDKGLKKKVKGKKMIILEKKRFGIV